MKLRRSADGRMPIPTTRQDSRKPHIHPTATATPALTGIYRHAVTRSDSLETFLRQIGSLEVGSLRSNDRRRLGPRCFAFPQELWITTTFLSEKPPHLRARPLFPTYGVSQLAGPINGAAPCMGRPAMAVPPPAQTFARFGPDGARLAKFPSGSQRETLVARRLDCSASELPRMHNPCPCSLT